MSGTTATTRYITTSIPFVNARPHVGFALELVQADSLARYYRQRGDDVRLQTGTDENSLKNVRAAEMEGLPTAEMVKRNADAFEALKTPLTLSFDDFIRTSNDPRHPPGVEKLWRACAERGDIYKRLYRGRYCVGCEHFYNESDLAHGLCPEHLTEPELVEEENYFFRLSRYQDQIYRLIESDALRIQPNTRRNEVLSLIRSGLDDFSISRSRERARDWGIQVPGDPSQVIYVWFDALGNYLTALDYAGDGPQFQQFWQNGGTITHLIGKGIIRFHAVYWPALLLSAGLPLPDTLLVHGYLTMDGQKISKSLGNTVDPAAIVDDVGSDALRYYLLRHIRSAGDGDFSLDRLTQAHHVELADQLGNLLSRTLAMVERYAGGVVPSPLDLLPADRRLIDVAWNLEEKIAIAIQRFRLHDATATIWELVAAANKYVVDTAPWELAKQADPRLASTLYNLVESLRIIAYHSHPFLPRTARNIAVQLGLDPEQLQNDPKATRWGRYPEGNRVYPGDPLFPKQGRVAAA